MHNFNLIFSSTRFEAVWRHIWHDDQEDSQEFEGSKTLF